MNIQHLFCSHFTIKISTTNKILPTTCKYVCMCLVMSTGKSSWLASYPASQLGSYIISSCTTIHTAMFHLLAEPVSGPY